MMLGTCGILTLTAQNILKPTDLVAQHKAQVEQFQQLKLFQKATTNRAVQSRIEPDIKDYQLLDLDLQTLQTILKEKPLTFRLPFPTTNGEALVADFGTD